MGVLKLATSFRGRPALNRLRRSPKSAVLLRGTGGMRAVLMAGRPMRSSWTPLREVAIQAPMMLLPGDVILLEGISRMIDRVLTLGPKKFWASPGWGLAGLAGFGRGNGAVPLAMKLLNPVASKKKGSSWMAARNMPPPRTAMFWPVLPWARMPVGGNRDAGRARRVTFCT